MDWKFFLRTIGIAFIISLVCYILTGSSASGALFFLIIYLEYKLKKEEKKAWEK